PPPRSGPRFAAKGTAWLWLLACPDAADILPTLSQNRAALLLRRNCWGCLAQ
ncbi:unnamed protein product, partial [Durusdinium trenchii]